MCLTLVSYLPDLGLKLLICRLNAINCYWIKWQIDLRMLNEVQLWHQKALAHWRNQIQCGPVKVGSIWTILLGKTCPLRTDNNGRLYKEIDALYVTRRIMSLQYQIIIQQTGNELFKRQAAITPKFGLFGDCDYIVCNCFIIYQFVNSIKQVHVQ